MRGGGHERERWGLAEQELSCTAKNGAKCDGFIKNRCDGCGVIREISGSQLGGAPKKDAVVSVPVLTSV